MIIFVHFHFKDGLIKMYHTYDLLLLLLSLYFEDIFLHVCFEYCHILYEVILSLYRNCEIYLLAQGHLSIGVIDCLDIMKVISCS